MVTPEVSGADQWGDLHQVLRGGKADHKKILQNNPFCEKQMNIYMTMRARKKVGRIHTR